MEAPPVRYTTTSDGFDIAYAVGGKGPPLVFMPFHFNHVRRRWSSSSSTYARGLAESWRVHLYDSRGQGMSTRGLESDPTPDDYRVDLEAVIAANQLGRFVLVAYAGFAHVAVRYAIDHPEQVHALILICTSASFSAWPLLSMLPLAEKNWDLFLDLTAGENGPDEWKARAIDFLTTATTQQDHIRLVRGFSESDVGDLLPHLKLPVLLLHSESQHWLSPEEGVKLAARIPNARLVFLKGDAEPDDVQFVRAALEFLGELPPLQLDQPDGIGRPAAIALSARQGEVL